MNNLNPDIKKMMVGTREMVEITIFPLSLKEEDELIKTLSGAIAEFSTMSGETEENDQMVILLSKLVQNNLDKIYVLVTDNVIPFTSLTNNQLVELATIVYEVNLEQLLKNGKSLIEKMKLLFPSMGQLPQSVKDTIIPSETFSNEDIEKEDLPEVK